MRLEKGQTMPDFKVEDIFGNKISSNQYKGKNLMISFYRYASCPLCNLRIHELKEKYEYFKGKKLSILAFFQSPKESILEFVGKLDAPFPIIADPERNIYKKFGVEESNYKKFLKGLLQKDKFRKAAKLLRPLNLGKGKPEGSRYLVPADFLIDKNLIIQKVYYGKDISDHIPINEITLSKN